MTKSSCCVSAGNRGTYYIENSAFFITPLYKVFKTIRIIFYHTKHWKQMKRRRRGGRSSVRMESHPMKRSGSCCNEKETRDHWAAKCWSTESFTNLIIFLQFHLVWLTSETRDHGTAKCWSIETVLNSCLVNKGNKISCFFLNVYIIFTQHVVNKVI